MGVFETIVDQIRDAQMVTYDQLVYIFEHIDEEKEQYLYAQARAVAEPIFHKAVYLRGLIEFTNICKNDCYYCGIRCSNPNAERYRLTEEQILIGAQAIGMTM